MLRWACDPGERVHRQRRRAGAVGLAARPLCSGQRSRTRSAREPSKWCVCVLHVQQERGGVTRQRACPARGCQLDVHLRQQAVPEGPVGHSRQHCRGVPGSFWGEPWSAHRECCAPALGRVLHRGRDRGSHLQRSDSEALGGGSRRRGRHGRRRDDRRRGHRLDDRRAA